MKIAIGCLVLIYSSVVHSNEEMVVGESNFSVEQLKSAIQMLKSDLPGRAPRCSHVEKIYSKVLEQNTEKNGKIFSREQWMLSGCKGTTGVVAVLYHNGLITIKDK